MQSRTIPVVLVFGESINDARSVAALIQALCPSLKGRVRARPRPVSLQTSAKEPKVAKWMHNLHSVIKSYDKPVVCVFVHRDADGPDPTMKTANQTEQKLRNAHIRQAHAVVPVEEIEAWWLLFSSATQKLKASWSGTLSGTVSDVDRIPNPKEELARRTRRNNRKKAYTEADSPAVAALVAEAIAAGVKPSGHSRSYDRFVRSVASCCKSV